jgi:hypothetical protein
VRTGSGTQVTVSGTANKNQAALGRRVQKLARALKEMK